MEYVGSRITIDDRGRDNLTNQPSKIIIPLNTSEFQFTKFLISNVSLWVSQLFYFLSQSSLRLKVMKCWSKMNEKYFLWLIRNTVTHERNLWGWISGNKQLKQIIEARLKWRIKHFNILLNLKQCLKFLLFKLVTKKLVVTRIIGPPVT